MRDPWRAVADRTDGLLASASSSDDPRGRFVGVAIRPPETGEVDPLAMRLAVESDDFAMELVALLARWSIVR